MAVQFQGLANMPASVEWFANIDNPQTRRAYQSDLRDCCAFLGIHQPDDFRQVTRAHVLAWRQHLEQRSLAGATIRRKLAALASLFDYLLESNPSPVATQYMGSSARRSTGTRATRRPWAITRPSSCSTAPTPPPCLASVTGRS